MQELQNTDNFLLGERRSYFNGLVRKRREELGITQKQIADACNCSTAQISHIEQLRLYPTKETANKISIILDMPIDKLFPEWLEAYAKVKRRRRSASDVRYLEIEQVSINAPELLMLDRPDNTEQTAVETIEGHIDNELLKTEIRKALAKISPRHQEVLIQRFGLDGSQHKTLDEVAKIHGISRERLRQIEASALRKLKNKKVYGKLREMLDTLD